MKTYEYTCARCGKENIATREIVKDEWGEKKVRWKNVTVRNGKTVCLNCASDITLVKLQRIAKAKRAERVMRQAIKEILDGRLNP